MKVSAVNRLISIRGIAEWQPMEISISQSHRSVNKSLSDADSEQIRLTVLRSRGNKWRDCDNTTTANRQQLSIDRTSIIPCVGINFLFRETILKTANFVYLPKVRFSFLDSLANLLCRCNKDKSSGHRVRKRVDQTNQHGTLNSMTHDAFDEPRDAIDLS